MTKEEIQKTIRRYRYVKKAIRENKSECHVYIGKRKEIIVITDEVKELCRIIEDVKSSVEEDWTRKMIEGILRGESDISLILKLPCERSMYYDRKWKFIEQIYRCCIAKQMVGYEELLKVGIA